MVSALFFYQLVPLGSNISVGEWPHSIVQSMHILPPGRFIAMRGPQPPLVTLTAAERQALETLTRRHTTAQQLAVRARIILAAAEGHNNAQMARHTETAQAGFLSLARGVETESLGLHRVL